MAPTPFTIRIPDATLADLRARLDRVRWPDEIPGAGWQYGTDLAYLRQLVVYWRTKYDWRVHEGRLIPLTQEPTAPSSRRDEMPLRSAPPAASGAPTSARPAAARDPLARAGRAAPRRPASRRSRRARSP